MVCNMGFFIFMAILIGSFAYAIREILNFLFPNLIQSLLNINIMMPTIFCVLIVFVIGLMFEKPREE